MSEARGRYQRSAAGMAGAMIVTLLVIAAFVAFRAASREDLEVRQTAIDYDAVIAEATRGPGSRLAHPDTLPEGWIATKAQLGFDEMSGEPVWEIDLLTDEGRYVGLRQVRLEGQMLFRAANITRPVTPGDEVEIDGPVTDWQWWDIEGDDQALVGALGRQHVVVFGSAGEDELEELAASLVAG